MTTRKKKAETKTEPQEQSVAVTTVKESQLISMVDASQVMQFGIKLKAYIVANKLSVNISGTEYAMVDGWKYAGMNFGLVPLVGKPIRTSNREVLYILRKKVKKERKDKSTYEVMQPFMVTTSSEIFEENKFECDEYEMRMLYSYECSCEIKSLQSGEIVSTGHATCSNEELKKVTFDEYAIASMAQTRAIGKAFRNLLGYVMKSVGYGETPAEEMDAEPQQQAKFTTPAKATIEELQQVEKLINNWKACTNYNPEACEPIEKKMHAFSSERAQQCIKWLTDQIQKGTPA